MKNALDERARHAADALHQEADRRVTESTTTANVVPISTRRHTPLLVAAALVAVVALVVGVVATNGTDDEAAPDIATTTPERFEVVGQWSVAKHHGTLTSNGDIVWVGGAAIPACPPGAVECSRSSAQRVDTKTGTVTNLDPVPGAIQDLAYGFDSLWVAHGSEAAGFGISRINPDTGQLMERWNDYVVTDLAVTADAVWASGDKLLRINPADNQATELNILPATKRSYYGYDIVPAGDGVVFIATDFALSNAESRERVIRADRDGTQRLITSGRMPSITVDGNDLWVASGPRVLDRYDLTAAEPQRVRYPTADDTAYPMLASDGRVWFLDRTRVGRFDPVLSGDSRPVPFAWAPIESGKVRADNSARAWIGAPDGFWVLSATGVLMKLGAPTG